MQGIHSQAGLGVNGAFNEAAACCAKGDGPGQARAAGSMGSRRGLLLPLKALIPVSFTLCFPLPLPALVPGLPPAFRVPRCGPLPRPSHLEVQLQNASGLSLLGEIKV